MSLKIYLVQKMIMIYSYIGQVKCDEKYLVFSNMGNKGCYNIVGKWQRRNWKLDTSHLIIDYFVVFG